MKTAQEMAIEIKKALKEEEKEIQRKIKSKQNAIDFCNYEIQKTLSEKARNGENRCIFYFSGRHFCYFLKRSENGYKMTTGEMLNLPEMMLYLQNAGYKVQARENVYRNFLREYKEGIELTVIIPLN